MEQPLKILQVLPSLTAGGAEGFVTNLCLSLTELGADVVVYLLGGVGGVRGQNLLERCQSAGIEVRGVNSRKAASLGNLKQLIQFIYSWQPNVIQANMFPAEIACAIARVVLVDNKAGYFRRLASTDAEFKYPTVARALERFFDTSIACSFPVARSHHDFMRGKHSNLVTIRNGGILSNSIPDKIERLNARRTLGIPEHSYLISHIGRYACPGNQPLLATAQKAHDVLIKSFADAFSNDADCRLALVGEGPLKSEAIKLTHSLGIAHQVHFLGEQSEPWPTLNAADLFFLPSRYEGMPNVLPEAASCGLPVVASDIPEISSLYQGNAWQLCPVDDVAAFAQTILKARANARELRALAIEAAPQFRKKYSMSVCAKKYLETYKLALEKKKDS